MSTAEIVRAWKDPEFRSTLSEKPAHPAGEIELADPSLDGSGANEGTMRNDRYTTVFGCHTHYCSHHCTGHVGCHP
jgi:mersacidin/lichenicidin family type 2 lantibiotic